MRLHTIYKDYDQEALDKQYNNRARVPDFARYVQLWEQWSVHVGRRQRVIQDVRYGQGERESLDIIPSTQPSSPMQVFFHGGYWHSMDKRFFHFISDAFIDRQVTIAVVNYPLAPQASIDHIIESCLKALVWLYKHGDEYNGDPERIFVSGHSAGGHIVAMLMATHWNKRGTGLPTNLIKGGCAISGLFDLTPIRLCYLNDVLALDEATAQRNSPVLLLSACCSPLILCVGGRESEEYHAHSSALLTAWSKKDVPITPLILPTHDHFSILGETTDKNSALNRGILQQMGIW